MDEKLVGLNKNIEKTQNDLNSHKAHVEKELRMMKAALGGNTSTQLPLVPQAPPVRGPPTMDRKDGHDTRQYWRSRRSSRFFPVAGVTEEDLRRELQSFFDTKLNMPTGDVPNEDIEQVRRVRLRRERQNVGEVIVLFSNLEVRDRIFSYARNLAAYRDSEGRPTAGIRFDIPDHLTGVHRTLLQYGHALWVKHGKNPEFKRNVRHDDVELSYCLDFKFPHKSSWVTVSYQRALVDRRASTSVEMEGLDDELSSAGT